MHACVRAREHRDLGGQQCLSVVDHVPGCDANGHHAHSGGGAGQRVISHSLAQVFGDAKAEPVRQDPGACRRDKQGHIGRRLQPLVLTGCGRSRRLKKTSVHKSNRLVLFDSNDLKQVDIHFL